MKVRWNPEGPEPDAIEMPVSVWQRWFQPRKTVDRALALADEMGRPVRLRVWPFTMTLWPRAQ